MEAGQEAKSRSESDGHGRQGFVQSKVKPVTDHANVQPRVAVSCRALDADGLVGRGAVDQFCRAELDLLFDLLSGGPWCSATVVPCKGHVGQPPM